MKALNLSRVIGRVAFFWWCLLLYIVVVIVVINNNKKIIIEVSIRVKYKKIVIGLFSPSSPT